MLIVKFKKLVPEAVTPSYSKIGDAGLDLTAISITPNGNFIEYGTGIAVEIPHGYVGLLFPRSSVTNKSLMLKNSVGVIDSNYRGEIKLRFKGFDAYNSGVNIDYLNVYSVGERVGQLLIVPIPTIELVEAEELSESNRNEGGFGSTGK